MVSESAELLVAAARAVAQERRPPSLPSAVSQAGGRPAHVVTSGSRLHFIGIGGIGMSGLATICLERGCVVSGCDAKLNLLMRRLQEQGAQIAVGHHPDHMAEGGADLVIYSSAVSLQEPELVDARARGMATISRGELLAALTAEQSLIAIAGAHGKTTTSGMASELLLCANWDPTVVLGGISLSIGTNARFGRGAYVVAETDESDGSFLHLSPQIAIVTNIDREHVNYYRTFDRLIEAFTAFVRRLDPEGTLICCADDPLIREHLQHPTQIRYGFSSEADVLAQRVSLNGHGSQFHASWKGRQLGAFTLRVPGRHNILNALSVISLGLALDIPLVTVREALAHFEGTGRRFQVLQVPGDIWLVEDYAHHPSEIQATLAADVVDGRHRIAVFQPHRFSRTQLLEQEFTRCFDRADGVIITDIYAAFEPPIPGVSGERLATLLKERGHPCVRYVPKSDLSSFISRIARAGDTIFFLGAGDIGEMCHDLAARLYAPGRIAR